MTQREAERAGTDRRAMRPPSLTGGTVPAFFFSPKMVARCLCGRPKSRAAKTCLRCAHPSSRNKAVCAAVRGGELASSVARNLKITRQRVSQIAHPEKTRARQHASYHRTAMLRPRCDLCEAANDLELHHWDYREMGTITLCRRCHVAWHNAVRRMPRDAGSGQGA